MKNRTLLTVFFFSSAFTLWGGSNSSLSLGTEELALEDAPPIDSPPPPASLEKKIKEALPLILQEKLKSRNPLGGVRFEALESQGYLFYYRAKGYFDLASLQRQGKKLSLLQLALADLKASRFSTFYPKDRTETLFDQVYEQLALEYLHHSRDFEALNMMEKLRPETVVKDEWLVRYAVSLWRTQQRTSFKRLVIGQIALFKDTDKVKTLWGKLPPWKGIISKYEPLPESPVSKISTTMLQKKEIDLQKAQVYALWKNGDLVKAETLAKSFIKQFSAAKNIAEISYDLGRIQEDQGKTTDAAKTFGELMTATDAAPQREQATFRKAWMLYLAKKYKEASEAFEYYTTTYPTGDYYSTSLYFGERSKTHLHPNEKKSTEDILAFASKFPLNFYTALFFFEGKLSKDDLLKILPLEHEFKTTKTRPFSLTIRDITRLRLMTEMKNLGMEDDLFELSQSFSFVDDNPDFMMHLLKEFMADHDVHHQVLFATKLISTDPRTREVVGWNILFPNPYESSILKAIQKIDSKIHPYFVTSIMRQESAFNQKAQSSAKAKGLMQLIDSTAKDTAKKLGLSSFDLLTPDDNVLLGTKTILDLLNRYPDRIDYALAAYNAGSGAVDRWVKARGHLEPLEFIESIPYNETRIYVKSILRNIIFYESLFGKGLPNTTNFVSTDYAFQSHHL